MKFATLRLPVLGLLGLALLAGCQASDTAPTEVVREVPQYSIVEFLDITNFARFSFSPDNSKVLVTSDRTGVFNAYALPVDGGEPVALTRSEKEEVIPLSFFPADERFLYSSDQGGNELIHIYVHELDGTVKDLTVGEGLRGRYLGFTGDDRSFLISTNERSGRHFDIYEYSVDGYERKLIYQDDVGFPVTAISPDLRYLALTRVVDNANRDIYLYDLEAKEMELLTPNEGDIIHHALAFSHDSKSLYFVTDKDSEFRYLVRHDLASGARQPVVKPDWDVMHARFSKHGKYLVVNINNDARNEMRLYYAASMEKVALPILPNAEIISLHISRDESRIAFYASIDGSPQELFVCDLACGEPKRLTRSLSPKMADDDLVGGQVVRFKSFDGLEIPGILYTPHKAKQAGAAKLPALVWVHGGPGGQSHPEYYPLIQFLVNHGYVVYAINHRGSSGYGKTFSHLDDRDHGGSNLSDCVASKRMLVDTGYVDPERIGIIGQSYGGYMVLAALTFQPEEFAAGIDMFGVANWLRTLKNLPPWLAVRRKELEKELGDFDDVEYLKSISPLFHVQNIVRPLMVLQGANDPRVLMAESDDIVAAARANGVPVEYIVFEDEGHGFYKRRNRERAYNAILDFADKYLKGEGGPVPLT
ncbi:MAG: S9 family peptidase [bacterium]|nr:S9 family peptidase [bacterium]